MAFEEIDRMVIGELMQFTISAPVPAGPLQPPVTTDVGARPRADVSRKLREASARIAARSINWERIRMAGAVSAIALCAAAAGATLMHSGWGALRGVMPTPVQQMTLGQAARPALAAPVAPPATVSAPPVTAASPAHVARAASPPQTVRVQSSPVASVVLNPVPAALVASVQPQAVQAIPTMPSLPVALPMAPEFPAAPASRHHARHVKASPMLFERTSPVTAEKSAAASTDQAVEAEEKASPILVGGAFSKGSQK